MRAALFSQLRLDPAISTLPDPVAQAGDVVIDVTSAPVLSYAREVFTGVRPMLFELPFVPGTGAIGRVSAVGAGATEVSVGDWVYCDPTLRARDAHGLPAISLQGLTANGSAAMPIQQQYRHGSWAEKLRLPLENVVPIGAITAEDAARWLIVGTMLVPYGGFTSVGLTAGETVVVNGATGSFGSAAVAVALAMVSARVVATGMLDELVARHGSRVRPALMAGDEEGDTATIHAAADAPVDVVLDILPPQASVSQVRSAVRAIRPGGRVSLMGGVGMAGGGDLPLPYPWLMRNNITIKGQWMYPRDAVTRLIALVRNGVLDLSRYELTEFPLSSIGKAISHAAEISGPFKRTAIRF